MLCARPLSSLFSGQHQRGYFVPHQRAAYTTVSSPRRSTTMVEGHGVHRVAAQHRKRLKGLKFVAVSPNGRFEDGAASISGRTLRDVHAHGKHLFYEFGDGEVTTSVVHVHFGMSGRFGVYDLPGPPTKPTTRLVLTCASSGLCAHLSAMIVELQDIAGMAATRSKLGPDPLREDANSADFLTRIAKSAKPIGQLLMDQSFISGVGNIYRAEVLFKAGVHPEQPGKSLSVAACQRIWTHSVDLLQRGFQSGSILTVDASEGLPEPWTRRYIYNHSSCGRCHGPVATWDMAGRKVYACGGACQPLAGGDAMSAARKSKMAERKQAEEFVSHCAPEPDRKASGKANSKAKSKTGTAGKKADFPALAMEDGSAAALRPGTRHLDAPASAAAAAAEKVAAGEGFGIEHTAVADDKSVLVQRAAAAAKMAAKKRGSSALEGDIGGAAKRQKKGDAAAAAAAAASAAGGALPIPFRQRRTTRASQY